MSVNDFNVDWNRIYTIKNSAWVSDKNEPSYIISCDCFSTEQ